MNKPYTHQIGLMIQHVRMERGLTQQQLAKALGTSQSAVNRIESGGQNLSMAMLARISEVLNREIVALHKHGNISFRIEGGHRLSGEISVKTSKNAAMSLLCASLLNRGTTILRRMPRIEEVNRMLEVLTSIGVKTRWFGENDLEIKPPAKLKLDQIDAEAGRKTRSVIMLMGSLMHLRREFKLPFAGGCKLGERSIRSHLYALQEFGLRVDTTTGWYNCSSNPTEPGTVVMYDTGNTPAENAIMAAARTPGVTELHRIAADYMVIDLCYYLQKLGVKIEGIGTHKLIIHGVKDINVDAEYWPSEDPIEAMTFLSIAATTDSPIVIRRAPVEYIELELLKLAKMGFRYTLSDPYLANNKHTVLADIVCHETPKLTAPEEKLEAHDYPGMNMDNLPYFVPIAATAHGQTLIHDWPYENRAIYYTELTKLNAQVSLVDVHRVYVNGPTHWRPAEVVCPPALRPAVLILIGMLAAEGTSILRNIYSISRGYEDLATRLNAIGAKIEVLRDI